MTNTTCPTCQDTQAAGPLDSDFEVCCGWIPEILELCDHLPTDFRGYIRQDSSSTVRGRRLVNIWVNDPTAAFSGTFVFGWQPAAGVVGVDFHSTGDTKISWSALHPTEGQYALPAEIRAAAHECEVNFENVADGEGVRIAIAEAVVEWAAVLEEAGGTPTPPPPSPSPSPSPDVTYTGRPTVEKLREIAGRPGATNVDFWNWRAAEEEEDLLRDAYLPCVTVLHWNVGEQLPDLLNGRCGECANCKLDQIR